MSRHAQVLIAGGSIAGLALANALETVGITYLVLEKWHEVAPNAGASIGIFPNGFRILDQLGCHDAITALLGGRDAFDVMKMRDERGQTIFQMDNPSRRFCERLGYEPVFVDRQMIIKILYDNLKDKARVLTSKGVVSVKQDSKGVRVETKDGDVFTGDILVGADGVHSTVRREMWRITDAEKPGLFPLKERNEVPTEYCCIFGISKPTDLFDVYSAQYILGRGHSYLLVSGVGGRIYWFLFKRLDKTVRGLYEKVPRYTDAECDALAEEHANDRFSEKLCFGDLYSLRTAATLQALPEVVFSRWHYGRVVTIGDAAHKFNPIGGQGGNTALEDVAVLTNELFKLLQPTEKHPTFTSTNIATAFVNMQSKRLKRARTLMRTSHVNQSIQAMDSRRSSFIAKYILPRANAEHALGALLGTSRPAARLEMIDVPLRLHYDSFYDERVARPLSKSPMKVPQMVVDPIFAGLGYFLYHQLGVLAADLTEDVVRALIGDDPVSSVLSLISAKHAGPREWSDSERMLRLLFQVSWATPVLLTCLIEGHRQRNRGSLLSKPSIIIASSYIFGIAGTAAAHYLTTAFAMTAETSTNGDNRHVSLYAARALLPSILAGYCIPALLMIFPTPFTPRNASILWQLTTGATTLLILELSKTLSGRKRNAASESHLSDAPHLMTAYKRAVLLSSFYYLLFVMYASYLYFPFSAIRTLSKLADTTYAFMGEEYVLMTAVMVLFELYRVFDVRRRGFATNKEALKATVLFLGAQVVLGPGAASAGSWWWREKKIIAPGMKFAKL